jgi:hypothetical protein
MLLPSGSFTRARLHAVARRRQPAGERRRTQRAFVQRADHLVELIHAALEQLIALGIRGGGEQRLERLVPLRVADHRHEQVRAVGQGSCHPARPSPRRLLSSSTPSFRPSRHSRLQKLGAEITDHGERRHASVPLRRP